MTIAKKETIGFRNTKDETGKEIPAPPKLEVEIQYLELQDVVRLLNAADPKVLESIVGDLNSTIYKYYRGLVETIGVEKVRADGGIAPELYTYEVIANLPAASKSVFDDETWDEFKRDYVAVMAPVIGDDKRAQAGAEILATRLIRVKGNVPALEQFRGRLNHWFTTTSEEKRESLAKVYQYLSNRVEEFIKANQPETILATF